MSDWKTIDTAPKDGTYVLVCIEGKHGSWIAAYEPIAQSGYKFPNPWMSKMLNRWHMERYCSDIPTHWQPLPSGTQIDGITI